MAEKWREINGGGGRGGAADGTEILLSKACTQQELHWKLPDRRQHLFLRYIKELYVEIKEPRYCVPVPVSPAADNHKK
jgi:hypothetical protein